jgi:hypothetical protein
MPKPSSPTTPSNTPHKEIKQPTAPSQSSSSQEGLWEVEKILDEKKDKRGKVKFLLKWAGIDPDTGKQWDPTWVCPRSMSILIGSNTRRVVRLHC